MTHPLAHPHTDAAPARPRRRWSDIHPAVFCAFAAALAALLFHALPEHLEGVRTVLIGTAVVTMLAILGLLLIERLGRAPDGSRHAGRRHTDWTRR